MDKRLCDEITLREYVDVRFENIEKATASALAANKESAHKAELAMEKRFESVNEFRAALGDNNRTLMPRLESEHKHTATAEKINTLEKRLSAMEDRGRGLHQGWIILVAAISVLGVIFMVFKSMG